MAGKPGMNSGQKGYSNNPAGFTKEARKALADFRKRISRMDDKAEALLEKLLDSGDLYVAGTGLKVFFERRWGKPIAALDEDKTALEIETLKAKLKMLEEGHDPDAHNITVVISDALKSDGDT